VNPASPVFAVLSVAGSVMTIGGGLIAWFKLRPEIQRMRAEARRVDVDAAVAEDRAEDEHTAALTARYRELIAEQTEALVEPLRQEVTSLRAEVASLRTEVELVRTRYWRAIAHIRALVTWIHRHHSDPAGLPVAAAEIVNDI